MINDEIAEKDINLAIRLSKISFDVLKKAVEKLLSDLENGNYPGKGVVDKVENVLNPEPKRGNMTLNELSKCNDGLSAVELTDPNLRLLKSEMKKYNVDFSAVKDGKGKYTLFFKSKDVDSVTHALKNYTKKLVKREKPKPSIGDELSEAKKLSKRLNIKLEKVKDRIKGARAL